MVYQGCLVSAVLWATLTPSHHKQLQESYLIIQGDHKVTIIRGTVCLVFQSPMLGIQLYLEGKERREVIRELATYLTPNAGTVRKTRYLQIL